MSSPLITCIIATSNAAGPLPACLDSLAAQRLRDFSVLVQDACSEDGTAELLAAYAPRLPELTVRREPDAGLCDAWNKALPHAAGEWILFLGADDFLLDPGALERIAPFLRGLPENTDYAAASAVTAGEDGGLRDTLIPARNPARGLRSGLCFPHQGLFHRRRLFARAHFNTGLRVVGDYDFVCRTLTADNYAFFPLPVAAMRLGGLSTRPDAELHRQIECLRTARANGLRPSLLLLLRLGRGLVFAGLHRIGGESAANRLSDALRALKGAPPVRTRQRAPAVPLTDAPLTGASPAGAPLFSLLVATINRVEPLAALLESLAAQSCAHFEVLIADQNPPDLLEETLRRFEGRLRITRIGVPNKGVSAARNALIPLARGEIIAFPDDDCAYAPHTLERVLFHFRALPHLGGLVVNQAVGQAATPDNAGTEPEEFPPPVTALTKYSAFTRAETYTQFFRKEAVAGLLFDPELGPGTGLPYGCGEDTDFLLRALAPGHVIGRGREVLVFHPEPRLSDPALPGKTRAYALGRMHLLRKHRFALWFTLANILYPLLRLPFEGRRALPYRKAMFLGRLRGFFACREGRAP